MPQIYDCYVRILFLTEMLREKINELAIIILSLSQININMNIIYSPIIYISC